MGQVPHSSKLVVICVVLLLLVLFYVLFVFVLFYVLFVCKCVLYYCHWILTQLQLTNIKYRIISYHKWATCQKRTRRSSCQERVIFARFQLNQISSLDKFSKNTQIEISWKCVQWELGCVHGDIQTDGQTNITKLIALRNFVSKPYQFIINKTQPLFETSTTQVLQDCSRVTLQDCSRVTYRTAQNQATSVDERRSLTAQQQESWGESDWPATWSDPDLSARTNKSSWTARHIVCSTDMVKY